MSLVLQEWTNENFGLIMTKSSGITKVITIHPEGNMNVWSKFHNPSIRYQDFSLKTQNKCEPHGGAKGSVASMAKNKKRSSLKVTTAYSLTTTGGKQALLYNKTTSAADN